MFSLLPLLMLVTAASPEISEVLTGEQYVDWHHYSTVQNYKYFLDGLCIQFLSMKLVQSFRVNSYIDWVFKAIGKTLTQIGVFWVIMAPTIIAFGFGLFYSFGVAVGQVSTIHGTFFTVCRYILGISNTSGFYAISPLFYTIWSFSCNMLYFYLILPVSIAVLIDAFSFTTAEFGTPSDI